MIELNFPEPATSEERFYDRRQELACIERAFRLLETRSAILQGDRRIGKTSAQIIIAKRLAKDKDLGIVPLMLPFGPTMRCVEDLAQEILCALCEHLQLDARDTGLYDGDGRFHLPSVGQYWQEVERLVASAPRQTYLICIDEFDSLLRACASREQRSYVLSLLQDLMERRNDLPLKLFLTVTNLSMDELDLRGSPLVSKSEIVQLHCFAEGDMAEMVRDLLALCSEVRDGAITYLFELSGGHPYVTKLLLENLLAPCGFDPRGLSVDRAMVEEAIAPSADDPRARSALTNLYDVHLSDREQAVLLLLAERQVGSEATLTRREVRVMGPDYVTAAEALVRRSYLDRESGGADPGDDAYTLRIGFFGHWLRRWERYESEAEKRLKEIRLRLRRLNDPWAGVEPTVVTEEDVRRLGMRP